MYTALGIMLCGILAGRILRRWISQVFIRGATFASILLLLFLLGAAIGHNQELIHRLPDLGFTALLLMCAGVGGSILFCIPLKFLFRGARQDSRETRNKK